MLITQQTPANRGKRKIRSPQHLFNLQTRPFQIQPFMLAPVIPGETLTQLMLQSRCVSDPVKNSLIGWWKEYYFFYVKLRDLADRDDLTEMMVDVDKDMSSLNSAADAKHNHAASSINYSEMCLQRVVEEYFRNEGEAWDVSTLDGLPQCGLKHTDWTQSVISGDHFSEGDIDVDLNADATIHASEVVKAYNMWLWQRQENLTEMDYDDFLRTHGISVAASEDPHIPELIRYVREFQYPSNTINPSDGAASSALSWSTAERADKDRFFKEPGFIFGCTVTRPKIYFENYDGNAADWMNSFRHWMPAMMSSDPQTSLFQFSATEGPLAGVVTDTGGYWVDYKDLFMYGDQFVNYDASSSTSTNAVALPAADLSRRFVASADIDELFVTPASAKEIHEDGIVSLKVKSVLTDTTPGTTLPGVVA
jgi:hypothetical protein